MSPNQAEQSGTLDRQNYADQERILTEEMDQMSGAGQAWDNNQTSQIWSSDQNHVTFQIFNRY